MTEPTADPQPVAVRPLDVFHDEMMAKAAADHQKRMADEAALRDRIAKALSDARRPGLGGMTEADAVAYMADAVLSVLPASAGQADRAAANLTTARATNQRLNLRAQQLESELAAYRRAVADWEITDTSTYVPLRTLAAIGKAAGISVPDRWELHYQRVERAEADRAAVLEEAAAAIEHEQDRQDAEQVARFGSLDHECAMQGEAVRAKAALLRRMAAIPAGSADAGHTSDGTDGDDPTESVIYEVVGDWGVDSADSAAGARAAVAKWLRAYPKCGAHAQQRIVRDWPDGSEFYGPWTDLPDEPAAGQSAGGAPQPKEA